MLYYQNLHNKLLDQRYIFTDHRWGSKIQCQQTAKPEEQKKANGEQTQDKTTMDRRTLTMVLRKNNVFFSISTMMMMIHRRADFFQSFS